MLSYPPLRPARTISSGPFGILAAANIRLIPLPRGIVGIPGAARCTFCRGGGVPAATPVLLCCQLAVVITVFFLPAAVLPLRHLRAIRQLWIRRPGLEPPISNGRFNHRLVRCSPRVLAPRQTPPRKSILHGTLWRERRVTTSNARLPAAALILPSPPASRLLTTPTPFPQARNTTMW